MDNDARSGQFDRKSRGGQQEFHRLLVNDVERPAAVRTGHVKLTAELVRFEIDVVDPKKLADLVEKALGPNHQPLERQLRVEHDRRKIMMMRLAMAFRIGRVGFVVIVEAADGALKVLAFENVVRVAVRSFLQTGKGPETRLHAAILTGLKEPAVARGQGQQVLFPLLRAIVLINRQRSNCCQPENNQ